MSALVYLEVLAACEHFATAGKQTRKRFFSGVDADVVDEFVFGLKRSQLTAAVTPETDVAGLLAAARPGANMLHADVCDQLVHRSERSTTYDGRQRQRRQRRVRCVDPLAEQFLFETSTERCRRCRRRCSEVREEAGTGAVMMECPPRTAGHTSRSQAATRRRPNVDATQLYRLPLRVYLLPLTLVVRKDAVRRRLEPILLRRCRDITCPGVILISSSLWVNFLETEADVWKHDSDVLDQ